MQTLRRTNENKMLNYPTAKEIIEQETFVNPLCRFERVLALPGEAYCIFELLLRDDEIVLNNIRVGDVHVRNGYGTAGLRWLKSVSERSRAMVTGEIEPNGHKLLNTVLLKKWYSNNGFIVKNGRLSYFPESLYH